MDENGKAEMNEMSVGARPDGVRLQKVLAQQGWQIVKMRARTHKRSRSSDLPLAA